MLTAILWLFTAAQRATCPVSTMIPPKYFVSEAQILASMASDSEEDWSALQEHNRAWIASRSKKRRVVVAACSTITAS